MIIKNPVSDMQNFQSAPHPPPLLPARVEKQTTTNQIKRNQNKTNKQTKKKPHQRLKWYRCKDNKENMVKAYFSIPTLFHKGRAKRRLQKAYLISDTRHYLKAVGQNVVDVMFGKKQKN